MEFCRYEKKGHVGYVTITRPERMNALHAPASRELAQVWDEFAADDDAWVGVLTGEGDKAFSAGNDLKYTAEMSRLSKEERPDLTMPSSGFGGLTSRYDLFKPLIARVNGFALGGGFEMALACDIIIAADDAQIGHPGVRGLGSPPINFWFYHVGPQWAKRLLLTGDPISGYDAARIGLVLDSVPAGEQRVEAE